MDEPTRGNVVLADANNYTSVSTLTPPTVETAPGADLTVCWDGVEKDILCHDMAGTNGIDNVAFLKIGNMTQAAVSQKLAAGQLSENYVNMYRDYHVSQTPTSTCRNISKFVLGSPMLAPATDYVESANTTYMLLFATGTTPGRRRADDDVHQADGVVDQHDGHRARRVQHQHPRLRCDVRTADRHPGGRQHQVGGRLGRHHQGQLQQPAAVERIDRVMVGFYQGKNTAAVEAGFLDIERPRRRSTRCPSPAARSP